ncbi:MAG TPA: MerR family transcriptional regulator, partial [Casimicrobiaceae bacterium]
MDSPTRARNTMKANELARTTKTSVHTVRYYRRIGLLAPKRNAANGYHEFTAADVQTINFIRRAQSVGLGLEEIRLIFQHAKQRKAPCAEVRDMVQLRLAEVDSRLAELAALRDRMRRALRAWRSMAKGAPTGGEVCRLIESLGDPALNA